MEQGKVRDHAIEIRVREGKVLRVTVTEFDARPHFLRNCDHLRGKIEAGRNRAPLGGHGRDITWPTTDIHDRHLPENFGGIEQRRNELPSRGRPSGVVVLRHALPAFVLKFCKRGAPAKHVYYNKEKTTK